MINTRSSGYPNEKKIEKESLVQVDISSRCKRQIFDAFSVYRLYITYTPTGFLFDLDEQRLSRHTKD